MRSKTSACIFALTLLYYSYAHSEVEWQENLTDGDYASDIFILEDLEGNTVFSGIKSGSAISSLFLSKLDKNGKVIWQKENLDLGGQNPISFSALELAQDGGYVLLLSTEEDRTEDVRIIKTDTAGNILFSVHYGYDDKDQNQGFVMKRTFDGGFIIGGKTTSPGLAEDLLFLQIDKFGDLNWLKTYRNSGNQSVAYIEPIHQGFLVAINSFPSAYLLLLGSGGDSISTTNLPCNSCRVISASENNDSSGTAFLVREDNEYKLIIHGEGDPFSKREIAVSYLTSLESIRTDGSGFIIAGGEESYDDSGDNDYFMAKISREGLLISQMSFGSIEENEHAYKIMPTQDGKCIFVGRSFPLEPDQDAKAGYVIGKLNNFGSTEIIEPIKSNSNANLSDYDFSIYDMNGRLVKTREFNRFFSKSVTELLRVTDVSLVSPGVYLYKINSGALFYSSGKIVINK